MLALALGRDLSEISRMPVAEFNAWRAYHSIFPIGDARGDLHAGIVASTLANVNRGKGTKAYFPSDVMPDFSGPTATQDEIIQKRIEKFMMRYH